MQRHLFLYLFFNNASSKRMGDLIDVEDEGDVIRDIGFPQEDNGAIRQ